MSEKEKRNRRIVKKSKVKKTPKRDRSMKKIQTHEKQNKRCERETSKIYLRETRYIENVRKKGSVTWPVINGDK